MEVGNGSVAEVLLKREKVSFSLPMHSVYKRHASVTPELRSRDRRIPEAHCLVSLTKCSRALDSLRDPSCLKIKGKKS